MCTELLSTVHRIVVNSPEQIFFQKFTMELRFMNPSQPHGCRKDNDAQNHVDTVLSFNYTGGSSSCSTTYSSFSETTCLIFTFIFTPSLKSTPVSSIRFYVMEILLYASE